MLISMKMTCFDQAVLVLGDHPTLQHILKNPSFKIVEVSARSENFCSRHKSLIAYINRHVRRW